jgi:hypothetical protein
VNDGDHPFRGSVPGRFVCALRGIATLVATQRSARIHLAAAAGAALIGLLVLGPRILELLPG